MVLLFPHYKNAFWLFIEVQKEERLSTLLLMHIKTFLASATYTINCGANSEINPQVIYLFRLINFMLGFLHNVMLF